MALPTDFQAVEADARGPAGAYPAFYAPGVRPVPPHAAAYVGAQPGQQYALVMAPPAAPGQQHHHQAVQVAAVPQMGLAVVCAPMEVHMPVSAAAIEAAQPGAALWHHQAVHPYGGGAPAIGPPAIAGVAMGAQHHHHQAAQLHAGVRHGRQPAYGSAAGNLWVSMPQAGGGGAASHLEQLVGASIAPPQATSVEDILQLLRSLPRSLPRGTSVIPVVADSLRYLDSRALAALLKELSKTGLRDVAFQIFDWLRSLDEQTMPEYAGLLDVFTYTTMIAQCTNHMHLPTALALVGEMRTRNVPLNTHTYSSMLNVCVKAGELELALDVFKQMLAEGLQPNLVTYNTLLEVYAKRGMWCEAVGVLDTLEQQRLVPEPRTFNIVMNACNAAAQYTSCIAVHNRMAAQKVPPTVGTYNAVILAHCKMEQLGAAQQLFREMQSAGCQATHTTFITLLQAAEAHSQASVAVGLLEQMSALGLRLTPQCYATAIGACAGAGQLATARRLLGDMLASSKAGMAAPAHIIMQLQDRCCDWVGSHRTYNKLLASGVRPDSQTTATAIEALWGAGSVASCLLALSVFEGACKQGVFRLAVSVRNAESEVEFSLPISGTAMGIIGLWRLLAELRGRLVRDGPTILRSRAVVLLGDGQAPVPNLLAAMTQWCAVPGVPFEAQQGPAGHQAMLTAPAAELSAWLLDDHSLLICPVMPPATELEGLQEGLLQEAEAATMARCRQLLKEIEDAEAAGQPHALPVHYLATRPALWQQLQACCALVCPDYPALPHSALALLDQAARVGLVSEQGEGAALQPADLAAAVVFVAGQAAADKGALPPGRSAPAESLVAAQFGVAADQLLAAAAHLRETRPAACRAPVSVYGCVELYLDTLLGGQLDRQVPAASLVGDALSLAGAAASDLAASGLPASRLAALVVMASRQARGLYPAWPRVLVVLTGAMHPEAEAQQLLQDLVQRAAGGAR